MDLKKTPLIDEHQGLGAKLAPFGGWLMPIQYSGIISEHLWTRAEVSLFDICHMGEFIINGDAVRSGLNNIVTFDVTKLSVGSCKYGFILNNAGGIIDDLVVYRVAVDKWMVVVNAATIDADAAHFRSNLSSGTDFRDISSSTGKLDLQGPRSLEALKRLVGPGVAGLGYYTFGHFELLGEKVIISRTGYTGELGYELYISSAKVVELWRTILADKQVKPAGLGARDTLRLEMAYPLYGQDMTTETTPAEADKMRFVDLTKEFLGKQALLKVPQPPRKLINFTAKSRRAPRHNYKIIYGAKEAGIVTSGSFSPSLQCGIGMGYADIGCAQGADIILKDQDVEITAVVTKGPFYKNGTAKISEALNART